MKIQELKKNVLNVTRKKLFPFHRNTSFLYVQILLIRIHIFSLNEIVPMLFRERITIPIFELPVFGTKLKTISQL